MAWGARVENGKWRLCFRKGDTIHHAIVRDEQIELVFPNQKKAKACADEWNEKYWDTYEKARKGKANLYVEDRLDMIKIARQYM